MLLEPLYFFPSSGNTSLQKLSGLGPPGFLTIVDFFHLHPWLLLGSATSSSPKELLFRNQELQHPSKRANCSASPISSDHGAAQILP